MKKCSKCDAENKDSAKFCHNCGARLDKNPYNLDSKTPEYGSTTGVKSPSIDSFYEHSANSGNSADSTNSTGSNGSGSSSGSTSSSGYENSSSRIGDFKEQFNSMGKFKKIIVCCCAVYLVLMVLALLSHAFFGIPLEFYTEEEDSKYDFSDIDLNGDGALDFEEVSSYFTTVPRSELSSIFDRADKNDNGLIKGAEYDNLVLKIEDYFENLEKAKNAEKSNKDSSSSASSSSSSSISSHSSSDYSGDGFETCPYCGSEAVYYSGDTIKCQECGRTISNPDDLDLNYYEGNYLLVPLYSVS